MSDLPEDMLVPAQGELFDTAQFNGDALLTPEQLRQVESEEQRGLWTAQRLKKRRPETYALVCVCRANGWSIKRTMGIAGVGFNTVVEIDRAEEAFIRKSKDAIAKESYGIAAMIVDAMRDQLPEILSRGELKVEEIKALSDVAAKLVVNANLLSGEPTENIGLPDAAKYTGWRDWEKSAQEQKPAIKEDE